MASQDLKTFLRSVNSRYLNYAEVSHEGQLTNQAELGAADRTDLQALGVPTGAAGLSIKAARGAGDSFIALLFEYQPLVVCQCCNLCSRRGHDSKEYAATAASLHCLCMFT